MLEWLFILDHENYDVSVIIELLNRIVDAGRKYGVLLILDKTQKHDFGDDFIKDIENILDKKGVEAWCDRSFFLHTMPDFDGNTPYKAYTKLAYYENEKVVMNYIHHIQEIYPALSQENLRFYHYYETGVYSPLTFELVILKNKELRFLISSGLEVWFSHYIGIPNLIESSSEWKYIDNSELFYLNTPRLAGFIKEIDQFFLNKKGSVINRYNSNLNAQEPFLFYPLETPAYVIHEQNNRNNEE